MKLAVYLILAATFVATTAFPAAVLASDDESLNEAAHVEQRLGLSVQAYALNPRVAFDEDAVVAVVFSNAGVDPVHIPVWMVDPTGLDRSFLQVVREGEEVAYEGAIVKRAAPRPDTMLVLMPGESYTVHYRLARDFDMSADGAYQVGFRTESRHINHGAGLESNRVVFSVEADPARAPHREASGKAAGEVGISFTGACTSTEQSTLRNAVTAAGAMTNSAASYLSGARGSQPRYTTWFGAYSLSRWSKVSTNFTKLKSALDTKPLVLDCSCNEADTFAYVYPTQPYKVYVCGAFWSAPITGTDSKAGTLVHELSHFNAIAGTKDHAYGQSAAKSLAASSPTKAIANADSYEYFAENSPALN